MPPPWQYSEIVCADTAWRTGVLDALDALATPAQVLATAAAGACGQEPRGIGDKAYIRYVLFGRWHGRGHGLRLPPAGSGLCGAAGVWLRTGGWGA